MSLKGISNALKSPDVVNSYIVSGSVAFSSNWLSLSNGGSALTPEIGKIYIVVTAGDYQNIIYRWDSTVYTPISSSGGASTAFYATLPYSDWVGSEAPYTQTITVEGIDADSNGIVGLAASTSSTQYTAASLAQMLVTSQATDSITITAYGIKPSSNISLEILIFN